MCPKPQTRVARAQMPAAGPHSQNSKTNLYFMRFPLDNSQRRFQTEPCNDEGVWKSALVTSARTAASPLEEIICQHYG